MKRLFIISATFVLLLTTTGCGSGTFNIKNENFQASDVCDGTGTVELFMENGEAKIKKSKEPLQTIMLKDGFPSLMWCHGLTHQFVDTVKLYEYTFESNANDPLKFTVDRKKGYYYTSGKGTVTGPDGNVTILP